MQNRAYIPVGTVENSREVLVSKGDILELYDGGLITFIEAKRVRFIGQIKGLPTKTSVPMYRNKHTFKPFVAKVTGKRDESVITKSAVTTKFVYGQLFSLEGNKAAFMYVGPTFKKGVEKVEGIDLATGRTCTIDPSFTFVKINVAKLKKENKPA
jgi:hypothetical protein